MAIIVKNVPASISGNSYSSTIRTTQKQDKGEAFVDVSLTTPGIPEKIRCSHLNLFLSDSKEKYTSLVHRSVSFQVVVGDVWIAQSTVGLVLHRIYPAGTVASDSGLIANRLNVVIPRDKPIYLTGGIPRPADILTLTIELVKDDLEVGLSTDLPVSVLSAAAIRDCGMATTNYAPTDVDSVVTKTKDD